MDYMNNLLLKTNAAMQSVSGKVDKQILHDKDKIIGMNMIQIQKHIGNDGKVLENTNPVYTGYYRPATVVFWAKVKPPITRKEIGDPYNFTWFGKFYSGFDIKKKNGNYEIFSRGTNTTSSKEAFFKGYQNLFGLTSENESIILDGVKGSVINQILTQIYG